MNNAASEFLSKSVPRTPTKSSPIKPLQFSPSQFLNSPQITFDINLSSTPVKRKFCIEDQENFGAKNEVCKFFSKHIMKKYFKNFGKLYN